MARFIRVAILTTIVFAVIPVIQALTMPDATVGNLSFMGKQDAKYLFRLPFSPPANGPWPTTVTILNGQGANAGLDGSMITISLDEIQDLELQIVAGDLTMNRFYSRSDLEGLLSNATIKNPQKTPAKKIAKFGKPGLFGPVAKGETLFNIARKIDASNEDLPKILVALWLENKANLINSNMNGLKAGSYISYEQLEENLPKISRAMALRTIAEQRQSWQKSIGGKTLSTSKSQPIKAGPAKPERQVAANEKKRDVQGAIAQSMTVASDKAEEQSRIAEEMEKEIEIIDQAIDGVRDELKAQNRIVSSRLDSVTGELKNLINTAGFASALPGIFGFETAANSGLVAKLMPKIFLVENLLLVFGLIIFAIRRMRSSGRYGDGQI